MKDYFLIQVDCTKLHLGVRNELFMPSRDGLKDGETNSPLREIPSRPPRINPSSRAASQGRR